MYDNRSPWRNTPILFNKILDIQKPRYIIKDPMDMSILFHKDWITDQIF